MPTRSQAIIRRDINRLKETVERHAPNHPALNAILPTIASAAEKVNSSWNQYQAVSVTGDKERQERDDAISVLLTWTQSWRPVIMIMIPGAEQNIHKLPSSGATPDDMIRVADDMVKLINNNGEAASFCETALNDLGDKIEIARKETAEATEILPAEDAARQQYSGLH